jgi:hypothetical protein
MEAGSRATALALAQAFRPARRTCGPSRSLQSLGYTLTRSWTFRRRLRCARDPSLRPKNGCAQDDAVQKQAVSPSSPSDVTRRKVKMLRSIRFGCTQVEGENETLCSHRFNSLHYYARAEPGHVPNPAIGPPQPGMSSSSLGAFYPLAGP